MSNLPARGEARALSHHDRAIGRAVREVHGDALVAVAEVQAIELVTAEAQRSAVGIALTETLCTQLAPHAVERFRIIAEAGTQALVLKVMQLGR